MQPAGTIELVTQAQPQQFLARDAGPQQLLFVGLGMVEIGTVTPRPRTDAAT
jgi:hypothetical protein